MRFLTAFGVLAVVAVVVGSSVYTQKENCESCPATTVANKDDCGSCCATATAAKQEDCGGCCASKAVSKQEECGSCCSKATATSAKQECSGCAKATSAKQECGSCTTATSAKQEACSECPVSKAMAALPKMTYKVGTETTCCSESAAALAEKNETPIHFVVADKTYEKKEAAYAALVETTESFVNDFATAKTCSKSGSTTVAGQTCDCAVKAGETAKLVKAAMDKVVMSYEVDGETCNCAVKSAAMAKDSGKERLFVVGDQKTCCEMTARMNLAHARYQAAVKAVVASQKQATDSDGSEAKGS